MYPLDGIHREDVSAPTVERVYRSVDVGDTDSGVAGVVR